MKRALGKEEELPPKKCKVIARNCVEIRTSSILNAGNGLWATEDIKKNQIITEYDGDIKSRKEVDELDKSKNVTHICALDFHHSYIDGLKNPNDAEDRGKGSFANDARDSQKYNAIFFKKFDNKRGSNRLYIKAKHEIKKDQEIFVNYGKDYWIRMNE